MPGPAEQSRRYGEEEVGLILKRAAELQRKEPASVTEGGGLTLSELEEIAAEAGIDPRYLRRAAEELDLGAPGAHAGALAALLGGPLTIQLERTLAGEFPDSEFEQLVPEIQRAAEGLGQGNVLGRTLTWQSSTANPERALQVTVSSRDGRTRIWIEEQLSHLASALYGGIFAGAGGGVGFGVGLGVGIGVLGSAAFSITFPTLVLAGSFLVARSIFRSTARRRQRMLRDLLDRLTDRVISEVADRQLAPERRRPELPGA